MQLPEKVQTAIHALAQYDIPPRRVAPFWYRQYLRFKPDTPPPLWGATDHYWSFLAFAKTLMVCLAVTGLLIAGLWEPILRQEIQKAGAYYPFNLLFLGSLIQLLIWTVTSTLATAVSNAKRAQAVHEGQALGLPRWSVFSSTWRPTLENLGLRTQTTYFWLQGLWASPHSRVAATGGVLSFGLLAWSIPNAAGVLGELATLIYLIACMVGTSRTIKRLAEPRRSGIWYGSRGWGMGFVVASVCWEAGVNQIMGQLPNAETLYLAAAAGALHAFGWFGFYQQRNLALRAERAEQSRQLAEVRLQMLKNQIEPHFIFNTLAHLKALIRIDPVVAESMADELSDFLRTSLQSLREDRMTVAQDFELVRAYLALASLRMGERLTVDMQMDPATAQLPVPPLMLQTLVENAIQHGIEPKVGPGQIRVSARLDSGGPVPRLVLEIADDGVGFGQATTGGSGLGLVNIRERLATAFGPDAQLTLAANNPQGVVATLSLPAPTSL